MSITQNESNINELSSKKVKTLSDLKKIKKCKKEIKILKHNLNQYSDAIEKYKMVKSQNENVIEKCSKTLERLKLTIDELKSIKTSYEQLA